MTRSRQDEIDDRLSRFARVLIAHAIQAQDELDALEALTGNRPRRRRSPTRGQQ